MAAQPDAIRAVWTSAYVSSLPDSSFAAIDDSGRHLPYKDANGKVDLPHLRNALARLDQTQISPALKAKARKTLEAAARANGVGDHDEEESRMTTPTLAATEDPTPATNPEIHSIRADALDLLRASVARCQCEECTAIRSDVLEDDETLERADAPLSAVDKAAAHADRDNTLMVLRDTVGLCDCGECSTLQLSVADYVRASEDEEEAGEGDDAEGDEDNEETEDEGEEQPPPPPVKAPAAKAKAKAKRADAPTVTRSTSVKMLDTPSLDELVFVPITRIDREKWEVEGMLSNEEIDTFGTVFDYDSMKRAVNERWHGNVREQHDSKLAVGRGVAIICDDDARTVTVRSRISRGAPNTWAKVEDGVLTGYSIGASNAKTETRTVNGRTVPVYKDFNLAEISLVDAPSNPGAARSGLTLYRAATADSAKIYSADLQADELDAAQAIAAANEAVSQAANAPASQELQPKLALNTAGYQKMPPKAPQVAGGTSPAEAIALQAQATRGATMASRPAVQTPTVTRDEMIPTAVNSSSLTTTANVPANDGDNSTKAAKSADYESLDSAMNQEHGARMHVHAHAYADTETHVNDHLHSHADGTSHKHPHMHTHVGTGDGSKPHVHVHDHGHQFVTRADGTINPQRSEPDVTYDYRTNKTLPLPGVFIGEADQQAVQAACVERGVDYGQLLRDLNTTSGMVGYSLNDGPPAGSVDDSMPTNLQLTITICPQCGTSAATCTPTGYFYSGQACPKCGCLFGDTPIADSDDAGRSFANTSGIQSVDQLAPMRSHQTASPAAPQPATVRTVATPDATRDGARISQTTRTGLHEARDSVLRTCNCDECQAMLRICDPDMDGDDDTTPGLDTDGDADALEGRVQRAQLHRVVHRALANQQQAFQTQLAPFIQRMQSIASRLTTVATPDLTRVEAQLGEVHVALAAVQDLVSKIAATEQPGGPVVRAVEKTLPQGLPGQAYMNSTPITEQDLLTLRKLGLNGQLGQLEQSAAAAAIFKQQYGG